MTWAILVRHAQRRAGTPRMDRALVRHVVWAYTGGWCWVYAEAGIDRRARCRR